MSWLWGTNKSVALSLYIYIVYSRVCVVNVYSRTFITLGEILVWWIFFVEIYVKSSSNGHRLPPVKKLSNFKTWLYGPANCYTHLATHKYLITSCQTLCTMSMETKLTSDSIFNISQTTYAIAIQVKERVVVRSGGYILIPTKIDVQKSQGELVTFQWGYLSSVDCTWWYEEDSLL